MGIISSGFVFFSLPQPDGSGNNTTVRVTSKTNADDDYPTSKRLVGYIYESSVNDHAIQNGRLQQMKYPNGNTVDYGYDLFDRITTESYTNAKRKVLHNKKTS